MHLSVSVLNELPGDAQRPRHEEPGAAGCRRAAGGKGESRERAGYSPSAPFDGLIVGAYRRQRIRFTSVGDWLEFVTVIRPVGDEAARHAPFDVTPGRPLRARDGDVPGPIIGELISVKAIEDDPGAYRVLILIDPDAVSDGWELDFG